MKKKEQFAVKDIRRNTLHSINSPDNPRSKIQLIEEDEVPIKTNISADDKSIVEFESGSTKANEQDV